MAKTRKKMRKLKNRVVALETAVINHLTADHDYDTDVDGSVVVMPPVEQEHKPMAVVSDNG